MEVVTSTELKSLLNMSKKEPICFLFTGQGSQSPDMGLELFQKGGVFRETMELCDELIKEYLGVPLLSLLYGENKDMIHDTKYAQPALFALEYSLAMYWKEKGLIPSVVMGHSVGEVVAATVAGVFSLSDGLKLIAARGKAIGNCDPQNGVMVAVRASKSMVLDAIADVQQSVMVDDKVDIASVNGPSSCVISGDKDTIEAIINRLPKQVGRTSLKVSHAFHSPLIDDAVPSFRRALTEVNFSLPSIPVVSNLTGRIISNDLATSTHWEKHIRGCVDFNAGINYIVNSGIRTFLELGPHPTLSSLGAKAVKAKMVGISDKMIWLPSLRRGKSDIEILRTTAIALREKKLIEAGPESTKKPIGGNNLIQEVKSLLESFLECSVQETDELRDLGLDSLSSIELQGLLNERFEISIPASVMFQEPLRIQCLVDSVLVQKKKSNKPDVKHSEQIEARKSMSESNSVETGRIPSLRSKKLSEGSAVRHNEIVNARVEKRLKDLYHKLMDPDTLMDRLENKLLDRILARSVLKDERSRPISASKGLNKVLQKTIEIPSPSSSVSSTLSSNPTISLTTVKESKGHVLLLEGQDTTNCRTNLMEYLRSHMGFIQQELRTRGGLLIRNCGLEDAKDFRDILKYFQDSQKGCRDYRDGISPRTKVLDGIFTSTEYSSKYNMALHNEMSYNKDPPSKIAFFCETAPPSGTGRTPLASSEEILKKLPDSLVAEYKKKGLSYIVNSPSKGKGPGVPWQTMYETTSKAEVDACCNEMNIQTRWNADGSLTTFRNAPSTRKHPQTGREIWFNHSHLFHPTDLPVKTQEALKRIHKTRDRFPKYSMFANGEEIPSKHLDKIRETQKECSMSWDWHKGDLLLLDNFVLCHGRTAYDSSIMPKRRILASMLF